MRKIFTVILVSFISAGAYAECGNQLIKIQEKEVGEISSTQRQCISLEASYLESLEGLCNSSKTDLSDEYKKYLDYKESYDAKIEKRDNATSDSVRRALNTDLYSIENEWQIYGYKWEMEPFIFALASSISKCASTN